MRRLRHWWKWLGRMVSDPTGELARADREYADDTVLLNSLRHERGGHAPANCLDCQRIRRWISKGHYR